MTLKTLSSIKNNEQSDVDEMENEKIDSLLAFDEDFLNKLVRCHLKTSIFPFYRVIALADLDLAG